MDGFYTGWSAFKGRVDSFVPRIAGRDVLVTGHSRGGALAALCARHLAKNHNVPCSMIAYGAPAQGTKAYRDEYNRLPVDATMVFNGYDIVPTLPPRVLGFRHVGKVLHMKQPCWHALCCKVADHTQTSYARKIMRMAKSKER